MVNTFLLVLIWKNVEIWEKRPFFQADMAGLGKYSMGGYGRIGVYRVKVKRLMMQAGCCLLIPRTYPLIQP